LKITFHIVFVLCILDSLIVRAALVTQQLLSMVKLLISLHSQTVLLSSFSLEPSATVLSVKAVKLQCATVYVNELHVTDVTADYQIAIFIQVTNIIEHAGTSIIRGLLCAITYSSVVDCRDDYVAVTGNELLSYKPIPQVHVDEKRHVSLSCRVISEC